MQRHMTDAAEGIGGRQVQKAVAQAQYARNVGEQSERLGKIDPSLAKLTDEMSNLETALPNTTGTVSELMLKHDATEVTGLQPQEYYKNGKPKKRKESTAGYKVSQEEADHIGAHFNNVTGNPDVVTVKRPEQLNTGKHKFDVLGNRNHGYRAVESSFKTLIKKGEPVTMESLERELRALQNKKGQKGFTIEKAEDGFWISNGTNASAITEGGINALLKVKPNGEVMGVMSDRHDWLEQVAAKLSAALNKTPGVNLNLEQAFLPKSLAAVTPPMFKNVYDTTLTKKALDKAGTSAPANRGTKKTARGSDYATVTNDAPYTDAVQQIINTAPSNTGLMAEITGDVSKAATLGAIDNRLTNGDNND